MYARITAITRLAARRLFITIARLRLAATGALHTRITVKTAAAVETLHKLQSTDKAGIYQVDTKP
jgi:hypothetical protein